MSQSDAGVVRDAGERARGDVCRRHRARPARHSIPDDSLGQVFASVVRLFAAKSQAGPAPLPFGRNSGVTSTDVVIGCSAMLDAAGLAVFELGAWQAMSRVGRQPNARS